MVDMLQFCLIESLNVIFFDSLPLKESYYGESLHV